MKKNVALIAKHLYKNKDVLKNFKIIKCSDICAMTGQPIQEGILKKDILSDNFNDYAYLPFESQFLSIDSALCLSPVIPSKKEGLYNSLRCYSYYVNEDELSFLKKEDAYRLILSTEHKLPFILVYSFSNKKHTSYKSVINLTGKNKIVTTDEGNVKLNDSEINEFINIVKSWYSTDPCSKDKQTFFNKSEIQFGSNNYKKIKNYGINRYSEENIKLNQFRNTLMFKLIIDCLQQTVGDINEKI